ncbi:MAG: type VI secretion system baseplate subunit TssK [Burkholderiales bacterium]
MSWNSKVIWSEGLFLQPEHFQQHDRYWERHLEGRTRPLLAYGWGFVDVELDRAALALGKVQIAAARGLFPDGTPFDFPAEDPPPTALDIPDELRDEIIVLAVPLRRPGSEETDFTGGAEHNLTRFSVGEIEVRDSNATANDSALIQVGGLRMRLMRKRDVTDAYATLGVIQVTERRADNQVVLSRSYIPPLLHTGRDAVLGGYVSELNGLLHQRGEALAGRLSQLGRGGVAEIADFLLLQTINRYEPLFAHFANHPLLHPERLYSVCLQLAGELATFSNANTRVAAFPEYRHDMLEATFAPVIAQLRRSLSMVLEQNAIPIELQDRKYGVKVAIIADLELVKSANFVLAVAAQVPTEVVRTRFPAQVKIGPVERIRDLVNLQLPGIPLQPLPVAPRQIPFHAGNHYFELERGGDLWKQLERSGGLAMHIGGEFPGLQLELWAIRG